MASCNRVGRVVMGVVIYLTQFNELNSDVLVVTEHTLVIDE